MAATLTGLFTLLELVEQLAFVGEGQYHLKDAVQYVMLTVPSRLIQVAPISMLLGSLLGLGALSRNAELTAMLSLGVPERRVIRYVLDLGVPIVAALFLLAEFAVPPAQYLAHTRRDSALSSSASFHASDSLWAQSDRDFLHVRAFGRFGLPLGIDIYEFARDGSLEDMIHADRAVVQSNSTWTLMKVARRRVIDSQIRTDNLACLAWHSFISPKQMRFLALPLDSVPPSALYHEVFGKAHAYRDVPRYENEFWEKASIPVSIVAMIMIACPLAFGQMRTHSTGQSLAYGVGVGIAFSLAQQILGHLGLLLRLSPALTALAPPLVVVGLARYLLRDAYRPASRVRLTPP